MKRLIMLTALSCLSGCAENVDSTQQDLKHHDAMMNWQIIQDEATSATFRCTYKLINYPGAFQKGNEVAYAAGSKAAEDCRVGIQRQLELELAKQPVDVQIDVRKERKRIEEMNNSHNRFDGVHEGPAGGGSATTTEAIDANTHAIEAQTRQMQSDAISRTIMGY